MFACCSNHLYPIGHVADGTLEEIWHGKRAEALREMVEEYDFTTGGLTLTTKGGGAPHEIYIPERSAATFAPGRCSSANLA